MRTEVDSGRLTTLPEQSLRRVERRTGCRPAEQAGYRLQQLLLPSIIKRVPSPMSQEKVLIVEDEENERTGLAELVSSWGYSAETARDGQEGHEKILAWSPSIVITDLKMPRLSGLELLERISGEGETIAVIVV